MNEIVTVSVLLDYVFFRLYTHFFHVSSFEEHKIPRQFHEYSFSINVHAISFSRGAIHLSMNTKSNVSHRCLSLLVNPSWVGYLFFFLLLFNFANAPVRSAQIARTKPHGHHLDLNFAFPYHAHFSSSSILTFRYVFISSASIVPIYYYIIITSLSGVHQTCSVISKTYVR